MSKLPPGWEAVLIETEHEILNPGDLYKAGIAWACKHEHHQVHDPDGAPFEANIIRYAPRTSIAVSSYQEVMSSFGVDRTKLMSMWHIFDTVRQFVVREELVVSGKTFMNPYFLTATSFSEARAKLPPNTQLVAHRSDKDTPMLIETHMMLP